MRIVTIITLCLLPFTFLNAQQPDFLWAAQFGNPPNSSDAKSTLASDSEGNFYMAAEFTGTIELGNKQLVSSGGTDVFLVKYNQDGVPEWSLKLGGTNDDYIQKIVTDAENNILLAGYFYGTTQIGPDQYTSLGSQDLFLSKFDAEGNFIWSGHFGGPMADYISGLDAGIGSSAVVTGHYYGQISFGDTTLYEESSSGIYTAKFSYGGQLEWVNGIGGTSSDQARSVSCDDAGNIVTTCSFYYDLTVEDTTFITADPVGVAVIKYSPEGSLINAFQLNGTYLTPEVYVTTCANGDFYLSGNFSEEIIFGNKTFDAGEFNQDIFIARYDASCNLAWAKHAHSFASDQVVGLITDEDDNLYITGHYLDSLYIDNLKLRYTLCCGSREVFILNINYEGNVIWGEQISGTRANIQAVSDNGSGDLVFSGVFSEIIQMGHLQMTCDEGFKNYLTLLDTETVTFTGEAVEAGHALIFPNPTKDNIKVLNFQSGQATEYKLLNMSGSLLRQGVLGPDNSIPLHDIAKGFYFLQLFDNQSGLLSTETIIKN